LYKEADVQIVAENFWDGETRKTAGRGVTTPQSFGGGMNPALHLSVTFPYNLQPESNRQEQTWNAR
jgi:hypothetical protein